MSITDMPQQHFDNAEAQFGQRQDSVGSLVDMANPDIRNGLRPLDVQNPSAVVSNGQMMFDNPFPGGGDHGWHESGQSSSGGQWGNERQLSDDIGTGNDNVEASFLSAASGNTAGADANPTTVGHQTGTQPAETPLALSASDQSASGSDTASTGQNALAYLAQEIVPILQQIDQEVGQLVTEFGELLGSTAGSSASPGSGDSSPPPASTQPGDSSPPSASTQPADSSPPSASTQPGDSSPPPASTQPSDSSPPSASTQPGDSSPPPASTQPSDSSPPSASTQPGDSSPPPASTTPSDALAPATISTPNGTATVGSTATVFGPEAMPNAAPAANAFYVSADATGNGTGSLGSESDPFSTLQQAQQAMENGNTKTTYVEGGTYDLSSTLNLGSADSGESFIAAPDSSQPAVIDGGGTVNDLVSINGANDITMDGLTMQNTQPGSVFAGTDWATTNNNSDAILAQNSTGDNFNYDAFNNVGVALNGTDVSSSQFVGNDVTNVQDAVDLTGGGGSNNSNNDTIASNSISNVSDVTSSPFGAITLSFASDDTISNNQISNVTGAGIRVGGNIGQPANGDVVTGNTVENTNTAAYATPTYSGQGDNGAIYAWQGIGDTNNMDLTVSNNYVANAGQGFENSGIYMDDGVNGATVTGNVIQPDGMGWASNIHGGSNNTFENNVIDLSSATGQEKGVLYQNDGPQMTNNDISNNIFYSSTANAGAYTMYDNANDTPTIANNTYQGVATPSQDSSPASANTAFVDPADGNYTVQS